MYGSNTRRPALFNSVQTEYTLYLFKKFNLEKMGKKIVYLLVLAICTAVAVGSVKYLNPNQTEHTNNSNQVRNTSYTQLTTGGLSDASAESTHVFSGTVTKRLDDVQVGMNTVERFEVRTKSDSSSKGSVPSIVIVGNTDESIEIAPLTTFTYRFYTKYDGENNWYAIIQTERYIID